MLMPPRRGLSALPFANLAFQRRVSVPAPTRPARAEAWAESPWQPFTVGTHGSRPTFAPLAVD